MDTPAPNMGLELIRAIHRHDEAQVEELLKGGAHPDSREGAATALLLAMEERLLHVVRLLIEAGANLETYDGEGRTPLLISVDACCPDFTRLLLDAGADVTHCDALGTDALYLATSKKFSEDARLIISSPQGQQMVRSPERHQRQMVNRALTSATNADMAEVVKALLDAGAAPNPPDGEGEAAISLAGAWGKAEIARMLLNAGADIEGQDRHGATALHNAAACGETEMVRFLLDHGADLNATDAKGLTPLHHATTATTGDILPILLAAGANPHARDAQGRTPLFYGIQYECPQCADALLAAGADPDAVTHGNQSPLAMAARWGYGELFNRLLSLGASPQRIDAEGKTLLHECTRDNTSLFQTLLEQGLDPAATDNAGTSVLMKQIHVPARARHILGLGGGDINHAAQDGQTALHKAVSANSPSEESIRLLLTHGANLLARDAHGCLPLHLAAQHSLQATRLLLEAGSPADARDANGNTLFHHACMSGNSGEPEAILAFLLEHGGADLHAVNSHGETPLHTAVREKGDAEIITQLLTAGVDHNAVNADGETALHLALRRGSMPEIDILVARHDQWNEEHDPDGTSWEYEVDAASGKTYLMLSAEAEEDDFFRYLIETQTYGIGESVLDRQNELTGETALHLAVARGRSRVMPLLGIGANPNLPDHRGRTPLHLAAAANDLQVATLLLQAGASASTQDSEGRTPHDLAASDEMRTLL